MKLRIQPEALESVAQKGYHCNDIIAYLGLVYFCGVN